MISKFNLCLFGIIFIVGSVKAEIILPPQGGPGGDYLESRCKESSYLVGINLRIGDDIDQAQAVCSSISMEGKLQNPTSFGQPLLGGEGGSPQSIICPKDKAVKGLHIESEGEETVIVNSIGLYCSSPTAGETPEKPFGSLGGPYIPKDRVESNRSWGPQICPEGTVAVGITSRSGIWLDAIGLICGPIHSIPSLGEAGPRTENNCSYGPDTCVQGFVWREAGSNDHVCVTPQVRDQTRADNAQANARRSPNGGLYGPDTCLSGYVWREAFPGDHVCVTPETRTQAAEDNTHASARDACKGTVVR
ncbi:hypothetical protein SAMN06297164_3366 [Nitrosomonas ureae]|uniref:Uncharacterized protein n=2 Tax=Nitrosomonas ureae TaxID=44577 RepID=A0A286AJQ3_9PROT|nr:hypothetical protein SAMN06297164_3366 [Nitrosomonas ureae]